MARNENLKTVARFAPTSYITQVARELRKAGYTVERDASAGTMLAKADDRVVVRAFQMGRGRPWILSADPAVMRADPNVSEGGFRHEG